MPDTLERKSMEALPKAWVALIALVALLTLVLAVGACSAPTDRPVSIGVGSTPELPAPQRQLMPTIKIAPAVGWIEGETPLAALGLQVVAFAGQLDHPRWLHVLPNGDVLVAESNAPSDRPLRAQLLGLKGKAMGHAMRQAGAATPSADRITLLRDTDGDGVADMRSVFLTGLRSPFGMTLVGGALYVANTDSLWRFSYQPGTTQIAAPGEKVADLPGGPLNHHWTKGLIASADATRLYVSVGSNSDHAEHGIEHESGRAAIWEFDLSTGRGRVFASGLRNPVGMAWQGGALWTVVNERDELGHDLVPDYMTSVRDGGFYGWPYSYFGQRVDERVKPQDATAVARAIVPDYALGAHTASLGLTSTTGSTLPAPFTEGMFVGQHGSWNRDPPSGYRVIFVPFRGGRPSGMPSDVLSGFLNERGEARGRPVGVAIDRQGALLVADDVGNMIWRVSRKEGIRP